MHQKINRLLKIGEIAECQCGCGVSGRVIKIDRADKNYLIVLESPPEDKGREYLLEFGFVHGDEIIKVWNKPFVEE